jgi:hypothetical protein
MSKVALSGNALGTGTFTIASPNSNTDRTLTLPDNTGTILTTATAGVPVNGPAFSAFNNLGQTLTTGVATKIINNTEVFDTNNNFDSTTNYRFTPTVAGYYQVTAAVRDNTGVVNGFLGSSIYKNGSSISNMQGPVSAQGLSSIITTLIFMNGTTDYLEQYATQNSGVSMVVGGNSLSYFQAFLARSAT